MTPIRVMLVDDQPLILEGIKTLLSMDDDISVIAQAKSSEEAIDLLRSISVDLILMDIRMPGMGGVEGTKTIRDLYPNTVVLILTTFDDDHYIIDALRYGAKGYLLKDIEAHKLVESIHDVMSGNLLLTGKVAKKLALSATDHSQVEIARRQLQNSLEFTEREIDIILLLVKGFTSKEISEQLYLTQGTVKNYFSNIYSKIGTNDRAKAMIFLEDYLQNSK